MRRTWTRFFQNNPEKLKEMLDLRRSGWSLRKLGRHYLVDHTYIRSVCVKAAVEPVKAVTSSHVGRKVKPKPLWTVDQFGERINMGKDYKSYLKEKGIKPSKLWLKDDFGVL